MKPVSTDAAASSWCAQWRDEVIGYLAREEIAHGRVGDVPAWFVEPYVSVWAIESLRAPGCVGWWVICGDLPTDVVSAKEIRYPREAVRAFARSWLEIASRLSRGEEPSGVRLGEPEAGPELAPLLRSRAELLSTWADDDTIDWD